MAPVIPAKRQWPGGPVLSVEYWSVCAIYVAVAASAGKTDPADYWPWLAVLAGAHAAASLVVAGLVMGACALAGWRGRRGETEPPASPDQVADYDDAPPAGSA